MTASNPLSLDSILQTLGDNGGAVSQDRERAGPRPPRSRRRCCQPPGVRAEAGVRLAETVGLLQPATALSRRSARSRRTPPQLKISPPSRPPSSPVLRCATVSWRASRATTPASRRRPPAAVPAGFCRRLHREHLKLEKGLADFEKNAAAEYRQGQTDASMRSTTPPLRFTTQDRRPRATCSRPSATEGGNRMRHGSTS